jgi:hypothetical protein
MGLTPWLPNFVDGAAATTATWTAWARHMSMARSYRSTTTPTGSETRRGSRVMVTASSGNVAMNAPSPVLLMVLAHQPPVVAAQACGLGDVSALF